MLFLLHGNFNDEEWVRQHSELQVEWITYFEPESRWVTDIHSVEYEHRYDDVYEKIETTISTDEQYIEWCETGVNHKRFDEDYDERFYREVPQQGFGIRFDTLEELRQFCVDNEAGSFISDKVWTDGSRVMELTDYWGDNW